MITKTPTEVWRYLISNWLARGHLSLQQSWESLRFEFEFWRFSGYVFRVEINVRDFYKMLAISFFK